MQLQNEKLLWGSSVEVYPNPAENILNVRYRLAENSRASIKITDAIGRVMEEQKISAESNNAVFALSKYSPGVYTLFLNVEGQVVIVKKIIVQK